MIVGIVAIPLAMAFAIAKGVRPEYGLYTAIITGIMVSLFGGSASASGEAKKAKEEVIYEAKEIKDVEKLFERAKNGESDLPKEQKQKLAPNHAVLKGNSKTKNLNVLSTTQLLKVTKKDGNEVKTYKRCFHFLGIDLPSLPGMCRDHL
ncbi:hypothetical protein J7E79_28610 [Bacillus sp. ISL-40]|nr:hypothetical protein [Bacillus sp. ISL-40]MBT2724689.1 hypothetical protein [Bacillus sp. ISL-46]MBT2742588.1 hypothetical protein [Bacillus sp. ISL-77]